MSDAHAQVAFKTSVLTYGLLTLLLAGLSACTLGPDYRRPAQSLPASFKEDAGWQPVQPRDELSRGAWWTVYGDAELNALVVQVATNNLNVSQAEARYRQARASTEATRAGFYPTAGVSAGVQRSGIKNPNATTPQTTRNGESHNLTLDASWEPDLWGRIRRSVELGNATASARSADLAAAVLSAQAELAQDYFQLRALDAQRDLLERSVLAYERSLKITRNQLAVGVVTSADVARAESLAESTQAQALDIGIQRAQLEHAIAILIGKAPAEFSLPALVIPVVPLAAGAQAGQSSVAPVMALNAVPAVPVTGLPASLLERRPDVASAERQMIAANAAIGVARTAYFPALTLTGSGALQAVGFGPWFDAPTRIWSLGSALAVTLFDGGQRRALSAQAQAAYDEKVGFYRQTVLGALLEVEDNLVALRVLEAERVVQANAVKSARLAETLALNQYKAGTTNYLAVVTAQTAALASERTLLQIVGRQLSAHVLLIKALAGSVDAAG